LKSLPPLRKTWWAFIFLVLFGLVLYLPFLGFKEFKGEEGRRAVVALEMLEKGDFFDSLDFRETLLYETPSLQLGLGSSF